MQRDRNRGNKSVLEIGKFEYIFLTDNQESAIALFYQLITVQTWKLESGLIQIFVQNDLQSQNMLFRLVLMNQQGPKND